MVVVDGNDHKGSPKTQKGGPKKGKDLESLKRELEMDEHRIALDALLERLSTNVETGLSPSFARKRLQEDGPNTLTPPPTTPEWIKFLKQLFGGFQILLWIGAVLCFLAYGIESTQADEPSKDNVRLFFCQFHLSRSVPLSLSFVRLV